jgi:hypothetical protein
MAVVYFLRIRTHSVVLLYPYYQNLVNTAQMNDAYITWDFYGKYGQAIFIFVHLVETIVSKVLRSYKNLQCKFKFHESVSPVG